MTTATLIRRSLIFYWRSHLAVAAGVGVAVAVLAGAFLVGSSVRSSLRRIALERLGRTEYAASSAHFFREGIAAGAPVIVLNGLAVDDESGRRALGVSILGVDERFFRFHGLPAGLAPKGRELLFSRDLARELQTRTGGSVQLRVGQPSAIPAESLHGRKQDALRTLRYTSARVLPPDRMGDFSLNAGQGPVRNVFVRLDRLQRDLEQSGRVNVLLSSSSPAEAVRRNVQLDDLGIRLRDLGAGRGLAVESDSMIVSDAVASEIARSNPGSQPFFTYLANTIRLGGREIPYSLVTATDALEIPPGKLRLNDWAARELRPNPGDTITLEYYVWDPAGRLIARSASFQYAGAVSMAGLGGDRELAPEYPGISDTNSLSDWDPPFPMDLKRVRKVDEQYWDRYRTAPKVFVSLEDGQKLWGSRFGRLTSVRVANADPNTFAPRLQSTLDPLAAGIRIEDVRSRNLSGARGATDFGEYFAYFSFFLIVAALLLAGLFFRFGVEQRFQQIGLLRATGWPPARIRRLLGGEAALVAGVGALTGMVGAMLYAGVMIYGLRTWWSGAVGTGDLRVQFSIAPLAYGAIGGLLMSFLFLYGGLRSAFRKTPLQLLAGGLEEAAPTRSRRNPWIAAALAVMAVGMLAVPQPSQESFFLAASLLIAAALFGVRAYLSRAFGPLHSVGGLGFRFARYRPGRAVLCIALIALATFTIVSVEAFRRGGEQMTYSGYPLMAESQLPIFYDLSFPASSGELGLQPGILRGIRITQFRLRDGEDVSCLNLYRPKKPRILGVPRTFRTGEPYSLLDAEPSGGAIPAIADANSLQYVLHAKLGEAVELDGVRFRFVGELKDSVFQSEILISEENMVRHFPAVQGYRTFLLEAPPDRVAAIEEGLADYGFDIVPVGERLAAYHRVENTYLSTFQALGALGLLLGTAGLGAILLRNLLERRREFAVLRSAGFKPDDLTRMVLSENAFLLVAGLLIGTGCALLAVLPVWEERGGRFPVWMLILLPTAVLITGFAVSWAASRRIGRMKILDSLRSE